MNLGNTPVIRVSDPANLISLVPYLLGFPPRDSLAIVALNGDRVLALARLDLPTEPADHDPCRAGIEDLSDVLVRHDATGAILIGYGAPGPVAIAVDIATAVLAAADLPVSEALRVDGDRYYSFSCADPACCPPEGTSFDPSTTIAAATATYVGLVAAGGRDHLAARLAPTTGPARQSFADATVRACRDLLGPIAAAERTAAEPDTEPHRTLLQTGRRALDEAIDCYRQGHRLDDAAAATLTVLLRLTSIRDAAIGRAAADTWQLELWSDLVRRADSAFVVGPANVLTMAALLAGDGVLASLAVTRALADDPGNALARLLHQAINGGMTPDEAAAIAAAVREALG